MHFFARPLTRATTTPRHFLLTTAATAAAVVLCCSAPVYTHAFLLPHPSSFIPHPSSSRRSLHLTKMTSGGAASSSSTTLLPHMASFKDKARLVLASKSPRRQEILQLMGFAEGEYEVVPSSFPEDLDKTAFPTPAAYATTNAECKAKEVATKFFAAAAADGGQKKTIIVIGSDTIVDRDGTILEKPDDEAHAHAMLTSLAGRQHLVHSGVAIFSSLGPRSKEDGSPLPVASFCESARVTFAPLTDEEIWAYVRSGEPMDKAGSYGIQGLGGQIVRGVDGCFFAVMGCPMHKLSEALARLMAEGLV